MQDKIRNILDGLSVDEIDALVKAGREELKAHKDELKEKRKAEREQAKAEAERKGREIAENLDEGDTVEVTFKGEKVEAKFLYTTEKRLTVEIDGEKKSVQYNKLHGRAEEPEADTDSEEEVEAAM